MTCYKSSSRGCYVAIIGHAGQTAPAVPLLLSGLVSFQNSLCQACLRMLFPTFFPSPYALGVQCTLPLTCQQGACTPTDNTAQHGTIQPNTRHTAHNQPLLIATPPSLPLPSTRYPAMVARPSPSRSLRVGLPCSREKRPA